ncbi:MAG: type II toxin-antitoxin system RelE/ParE family toxin [Caulobacterales bacterium]|nr:type II toxin-antitoxin system RelE/ParE family toxin [Caulobacterales bacterium]
MKLRWSRSALDDLRAISRHFSESSPRVARSVIGRIRQACLRLEIFPRSGRRSRIEGVFELVTPQLPYIVTYRVADDSVAIIGLFPASRDPAFRKCGP